MDKPHLMVEMKVGMKYVINRGDRFCEHSEKVVTMVGILGLEQWGRLCNLVYFERNKQNLAPPALCHMPPLPHDLSSEVATHRVNVLGFGDEG